MKKIFPLLFSWFSLSLIWGIFRLFDSTEVISELIAKPFIWLGITALFLKFIIIPENVVSDLKTTYLTKKPFIRIFIIPFIGILLYFFLLNFNQISLPDFIPSFLLIAIIINFSTAVVEEFVYRGIIYVWLLNKTNEYTAFLLVQTLFLLGHIPILLLNSTSIYDILTKSFFIILLGSVHTGIFRVNKSLYSSIISHGTWNTLVYYLLLS